jgi:hypothetical protein
MVILILLNLTIISTNCLCKVTFKINEGIMHEYEINYTHQNTILGNSEVNV